MELHTPLGREILDLRAGDLITLSGTVYTARDEAHIRMCAIGIPFNSEGAVVYHCGPVVKDERIIAAGPTTSARMNPLTPFLIEKGVRAIIGKGGMDGSVVESLRGRAIYLAFSGGCAVLAASRMALKGILWEDLGMAEAVWVIELDRLPLVVGIDVHGNDLFAQVREMAEKNYHKIQSHEGLPCP
ncbi:MAG: FumA C-terminus/TtdB family hydratase beta subunit [Methanomicrobiales archaeon]|nr:FumA C-terminus/TtdB family hydratase beta subunit [Methanomicrobiales archaeon]